VTNEHSGDGKAKTEAWIEKHGAEYAYSYFDGNVLSNAVNHRAWPHAALIAPDGTILWTGHPSGITDSMIEQYIEGAITKPLFQWDDAVRKVADALRAKELGKALKEAQKLAEKGVTDSDVALATAERLVEKAVRSVEGAFEEGNFLDALTNAERYAKQLKGLDAATRLEEIITHCGTDDVAKEVIKTQQKLRALLGKRLKKQRDADSLIEKLREMATEHAGTYVAVEAERAIAEVQALRETLR
jgi:hypothetical protein